MFRQLLRTRYLALRPNARRLFTISKPATYRVNTRAILLLGFTAATTVCGILAFPMSRTVRNTDSSKRNGGEHGDNDGEHGDNDGKQQKAWVHGLELQMLFDRVAYELGVKQDFNFNNALAAAARSTVGSTKGAVRIDYLIFPSKFPCEDSLSISQILSSPLLDYKLFGIYDGHNGPALARTLSDNLPELVRVRLADLYSQHASIASPSGVDISTGYSYANDTRNPVEPLNPTPPPKEIDDTIKKAFLDFDNYIVHGSAQVALGLDKDAYKALSGGLFGRNLDRKKQKLSRADGISALENAYAGSCVLFGIYDPYDRSLRVALTGNSRAVLGRRVPIPENLSSTSKHVYEVHALSEDQNASNKSETSRLTTLHPDEPDSLNGVLGWGNARAFGDGMMKWSVEVQRRLHEEYLGDHPREDVCKTPPYLTAEPIVTTFSGVQRGDFAVFASDGLWDCLGSEEVVGLVGKWLEEWGIKERMGDREIMLPPKKSQDQEENKLHQAQTPGSMVITTSSDNTKAISPSQLPVIYPKEYNDTTTMYKYWNTEKRFICMNEDKVNVGAHLVRNALGGADRNLAEALVKIRGPRGSTFRDDISILVVFFD